jgi:NADH-quinone oxidoreductase subunit J
MESFLFYFGGTVMLLGAVGMVTSRSAVGAACWLIGSFLGLAGVFASLHAPFLAVMQVLVYAGAVMVLFLFVIMMLEGPVMEGEVRRPRFWVPVAALVPAAVILASTFVWLRRASLPGFDTALPEGFGQPLRIARYLMGDYLFAFELISIVLLVALIGALALGRNERKLPWK